MHLILLLVLQAATAPAPKITFKAPAAATGQATPKSAKAPAGSSVSAGQKTPAAKPLMQWSGKTGTAINLALLPQMLGGAKYQLRPIGIAGERIEGLSISGGAIIGTAPAKAGKYRVMIFTTVKGRPAFQMAFFDVTS